MRIRKQRKVQVALLYEHKSYKEEYPHWQLNQYMLNVWRSGLKQKKIKPIPIIPIVIYHGKEKWDYQPTTSYFENIDENLIKFIPNFEYVLFNLNKISDKQIVNFRNKFLAVSALLFKHSRFKKYIKKIETDLVELLKLIDNQASNNFSVSMTLYIQNTDELPIAELIAIFSKVSININNTVMTTAEQLISQGFNQGISQGINQGINQGISQGINQGINQGISQGIDITKINIVKKGYQNGLSVELLANITDLTTEKVGEIIEKVKLGLL